MSADQRLGVAERRREHRHRPRKPQFPSATAMLRSSPRRFARFPGEFLKRRENSSCDSPINSTSFAPWTPWRGQKASPLVIGTNLGESCGHTSWQMSQP